MSQRTKVMVVLAVGRSGTSAVAKGLHLAGFDMGRHLLPPSDSNPEGHYEDRRLVDLNDDLLESCGGTWCSPPPFLPHQDSDEFEAMWRLCSHYISERMVGDPAKWGMKDPRLVLLWPLWHRAFVDWANLIELIKVPVMRDPIMAARSYVARDGGDIGDWLDVIGQYQDRMRRWVL